MRLNMVNLTTKRTANFTILLACTLLFHKSSTPQVPISNDPVRLLQIKKFAEHTFTITHNSSE